MSANGATSLPEKGESRFEVSVNDLWPGQKLKSKAKGETRWGRHTGAWLTEKHTLESFARRVCVDGFAFCAVLKEPWRTEANFESVQVLATDHDGASLDVLLGDPFVQDHASLVYETISSTPDDPHCRAVFVLDQPIQDPDPARLAYRALIHHFANGAPDAEADRSCKDPTRFFYGRPNARHIVLGNVLYMDTLQDIIEQYTSSATTPGLPASPKTFTILPTREHTGEYNPHYGVPLHDGDRQHLTKFLSSAGLKLVAGRFNGPCVLPHVGGPCSCPGAMYVSPLTGYWHCFCGDHIGRVHGGPGSLHIAGLQPAPPNGQSDEGLTPKPPTPPDCSDCRAHDSAPATEDAKARRRALVDARNSAFYGARRAFASRLSRAGDAELYPQVGEGTTRHGWLWLKAFDGIPILLEDPRQAPSTADLLELRRQVEPRTNREIETEQEAAGVRAMQTCGWDVNATCPAHGQRFRTKKTCCLSDHSFCPTQTTKAIRVLTLPDAPQGGSYRAVWLAVPFGLPVEDAAKAVQGFLKGVTRSVQLVRRRKIGKGLLSKGVSFAMALGESVAHIKLVFLEQTTGDSDAVIAEVCRALGAIVIGDKRLSTPDLAVLQLMEDSTYHLFGLESLDPVLYAGWFFGVRGLRLFESYGILRVLLDPWPAKGEVTIPAGATEAEVEHKLGTQVLIEAKPSGYINRPWKERGVVSAQGKVRDWQVTGISEQLCVLKLDAPSPVANTFLWRGREDPMPVCDICGMPLVMELVEPDGDDNENVWGERWGPGRG